MPPGSSPSQGTKHGPRVLGAYCCSGLGHTHLCGSLPSHLRFCSSWSSLGPPPKQRTWTEILISDSSQPLGETLILGFLICKVGPHSIRSRLDGMVPTEPSSPVPLRTDRDKAGQMSFIVPSPSRPCV